jgi:hypothetical protein
MYAVFSWRTSGENENFQDDLKYESIPGFQEHEEAEAA